MLRPVAPPRTLVVDFLCWFPRRRRSSMLDEEGDSGWESSSISLRLFPETFEVDGVSEEGSGLSGGGSGTDLEKLDTEAEIV